MGKFDEGKVSIKIHRYDDKNAELIIYENGEFISRKDINLNKSDISKGLDLNSKIEKETVSIYGDMKVDDIELKNLKDIGNDLQKYGTEILEKSVDIKVEKKKKHDSSIIEIESDFSIELLVVAGVVFSVLVFLLKTLFFG